MDIMIKTSGAWTIDIPFVINPVIILSGSLSLRRAGGRAGAGWVGSLTIALWRIGYNKPGIIGYNRYNWDLENIDDARDKDI